MTWVFDAPTGVFKNHALSSMIYEAAVADSVFVELTKPVPGFGRKQGENVTLTRVRNLTEPSSITLSETQRIPEDTFTLSTTSITAVEIGRAVPYTSLSEDFSHFDLSNSIQRKLKDNLQLGMDTMAADAFQATQIKYAVTGLASNNITTNGTFGATSTDNMNLFHVEQISDYLYDTLAAPPFIGDDYCGVFRRLGLRGIMDDPAFDNWRNYADPQSKMNSEVGRLERIRFKETNHNAALGKVGTGSVLGEGVVFGSDAVAMAEVRTPELMASMGDPGNANRDKVALFYGILQFGIIWNTGNSGEARIIHVGSL